ncbi:hypothetical protein ACP4OV_014771 [Aristida adscensionis]
MDDVCELCGAVGYKDLLVQCNDCKNSMRHRYCMDTIIYGGLPVEWLCDDCLPKHNELIESLDDVSNQRQQSHIQLGSSIINGPNMNTVEVTKGTFSWGQQRCRSRKARKCRTNAFAKQFLGGDTFNSPEMFNAEMLKHNDIEKEVRSKIDVIYASGCADGSSYSHSVPAKKIEDGISCQKTMVVIEPTLNAMEQLNLSKEKGFCLSSSKYVEGSLPRGMAAYLLPSNNDVEQSLPFVADGSSPTLPSIEQADGSSPTLESENPQPSEVVKSLAHKVKNDLGSEYLPNYSQPMQGSDLNTGNMDVLNPSNENLASRSTSKTVEPPSSSNERDFERSCPFGTNDSSPALESEQKPHPLEVVKPLVYEPMSILGSNSASHYSQPMQGPDIDAWNMDVLDPSKECVDLMPMSKALEPSKFSHEQGGSTHEKDNAERTKCLEDKEIVTHALDIINGLASPSMAKECLAVHNSDEEMRSDKFLLSTIDNQMREKIRASLSNDILSSEVHHGYYNHSERDDLLNVNGSSKPTLSMEGNQQTRDVHCDVGKSLFCAGNDVVCQQAPQMEGVIHCKHVHPGKSAQSNSKNICDRSNKHGQNRSKHQIIKKNANDDHAQLRSARSAASLEDNQKVPDAASSQLDGTYLGVSLDLPSERKEASDTNSAEQECSNAAQALENGNPKKRKRAILPLNKDEQAKATLMKDLTPGSHRNDGQLKKHRKLVENEANQRRLVGNCEESLQRETLRHQSSHNDTQVKKRGSIEEKEDGNSLAGNLNIGWAKNDIAQLASHTVVAEDHNDRPRTSVIPSPAKQRQRFTSVLPVDKPYWTGIMKVGREYISLAAHFSTKACNKVHELSRSLPPVMKVEKCLKVKAWPKQFRASGPSADSIGLYFFSNEMRPDKDLDRLLLYVTDHSIVLKYIMGFAELLIFPSVLLPEQCQTLQGKHYLWGVFRRRKGSKGCDPMKKQDCTSHVRNIEQQEKPMSKGGAQVQKQDLTSQIKEGKKEQQKKGMSKGCAPEQKQDRTSQVRKRKKEQQDKVQGDTPDQERCVEKHTVPSENQPAVDAVHDTATKTNLGDQGNLLSNSEAPPAKLLAIVRVLTPRAEQRIRELESEGALLFDVKGLTTGLVADVVGSEQTPYNHALAS